MTSQQQPLRVAMVVERFPQEPFIVQQVTELLKRSVDVHVLCQICDTTSELWSPLMKGRVHAWPDRGHPVAIAMASGRVLAAAGLRRPRRLLAAVAAERQATEKSGRLSGRLLFDARVLAIDPDIVHFQFGDLARQRIHLATAVDVGFTSSFRGYDLTYAGLDQPGFYDQLWPVLDGAHTLGRDLRRVAVSRGCPADVEWTLISPAVDLDLFDTPHHAPERHGSERPYRIVSVGRLHWKKGLPDGLLAIAGLKTAGRNVEYRIVGDGPEEERLRWAIGDLGLSENVTLVGRLDAAGVRDEMRQADVLVHPALSEGFGNAVLEAQAMGLPVVCTDAEGLAENVVHGETGLVVPRRSPDALSRALLRLMTQEGLGHRMGERGTRRVAEHFDLATQTSGFVAFFRRVVDERNRDG